jgi:dienelactone hydrolase
MTAVAALAAPTMAEAQLAHQDLRIPMAEAGSAGLEAFIVWPDGPGRHPLALISHGSPRSADDRPQMTAASFMPEAQEFARRGWAAAVVMRRGYGSSGGGWAEGFGDCAHANFIDASKASNADLAAAVKYLATLPMVDASRILAVGHSAGGLASLAFAASQPSGLVGVINFAGGRGSTAPDAVCAEDALLAAFHAFGAKANVPMIWLYAQNDHFFGPALAQKFKQAFEQSGTKIDFEAMPAFGDDGHQLFSQGISQWTPKIDAFLQQKHLVLQSTVLSLPSSNVAPPSGLNESGRKAFQTFLEAPFHRAFVVGDRGAYGWRSGRRNSEEAVKGAMDNCTKEKGVGCKLYMEDDVAPKK